jgi:transcriptional regulator with XRE-family HTH domain
MNEPRGYGFNPQQLIRLRQERGFSQRQLAEASGLARMGIVRYEQGTSEPRMESVQSIARELGVDPKVFFDWSSTEGPSTESAPKAESALKVLSISPPPVAAASPLAPPDPVQAFAQNMALLGKMDLRALNQLLEVLTSSDNPLDYDQDLYDRDLAELIQATPNSLKTTRKEFALSIRDLSQLTGLNPERLTDLEGGRGIPPAPQEIFALRKALGVKFDPRAIAFRTSVLHPAKDRRAAPAKHTESVREWQTRCQRIPNQLETLLSRLSHWEESLQRQLAGVQRELQVMNQRLLAKQDTEPK